VGEPAGKTNETPKGEPIKNRTAKRRGRQAAGKAPKGVGRRPTEASANSAWSKGGKGVLHQKYGSHGQGRNANTPPHI